MAGDRSPNYPYISLADAIGRVQTIYEKERLHPAGKLAVAKALGYGSLNGLSRSVLSALEKYGLLVEADDQLRVSPLALDIVTFSPGAPERVAALQQAAFRPALFSELRATFDGSLPSEENLRAFLLKRGFNPNTVENVIRAYRDTVMLVEQEAAQALQAVQTAQTAMAAAALEELAAASAPCAPEATRVPGPITMFPPPAVVPAPMADLELVFNLAPGVQARVAFRGPVTQLEIEKLQQFLALGMDTFPPPAGVEVPIVFL